MSSTYYSTPQPPRASNPFPYPLLISASSLSSRETCSRATSYLATEVETTSQYLFGSCCKTWNCPYCCRVKVRRLSWLTSQAAHNRLLTLTTDPKLFCSPRDAFERTASYVPELIRALRVRFGEVEYLRVTETCKNGYPHYHLLVRSGYLPQPVIKSLWTKYTGCSIVDCRQVTQSFSAFNYLVKYLSKMHNLGWTERHVSTSKRFFPIAPPPDAPPRTWACAARDPLHPYVLLGRWYGGLEVLHVSATAWLLPQHRHDSPLPVKRTDFGLPAEPVNPRPVQPQFATIERFD